MPLTELLKGIYFHELEVREKIFIRLQFNSGAYVVVFTIMAYMARMVDYSSLCWVIALFYAGLFLTLTLVFISAKHTFDALTGYEYALFPGATRSVEYCQSLSNQKDDQEGSQGLGKSEQMLEDYVLDSLAKCTDKNVKINNDRRCANRKALLYLSYAAIPLAISACLFVFFDLDVSSPRKNSLIEDSRLRESIVQSSDKLHESINLLAKEISQMSNENNTQSNQQQPKPQPQPQPAPSPPAPPQPPPLQYSIESYWDPLPNKPRPSNEEK